MPEVGDSALIHYYGGETTSDSDFGAWSSSLDDTYKHTHFVIRAAWNVWSLAEDQALFLRFPPLPKIDFQAPEILYANDTALTWHWSKATTWRSNLEAFGR